jgi:hypothetical protein
MKMSTPRITVSSDYETVSDCSTGVRKARIIDRKMKRRISEKTESIESFYGLQKKWTL